MAAEAAFARKTGHDGAVTAAPDRAHHAHPGGSCRPLPASTTSPVRSRSTRQLRDGHLPSDTPPSRHHHRLLHPAVTKPAAHRQRHSRAAVRRGRVQRRRMVGAGHDAGQRPTGARGRQIRDRALVAPVTATTAPTENLTALQPASEHRARAGWLHRRVVRRSVDVRDHKVASPTRSAQR